MSDVETKRKKAEYQRAWRAANPDKARATARKSREKHRDKRLAYLRNYYQENQEKHRAYKRERLYGITQEQYDERLTEQGGRCALCYSDQPHGVGGFHVDHCHDTKRIRGLLCHLCNTGLGLLRHDLDVIKRAPSYLNYEAENT